MVVDVSPVGLGAILIQHDEQGVLKVLAFASRALTVVEQRYCQTEREALVCVSVTELYYISGDCALIPRQSTNCNQKHGGFGQIYVILTSQFSYFHAEHHRPIVLKW